MNARGKLNVTFALWLRWKRPEFGVKLLVLPLCVWFGASLVSAQSAGQIVTASSYSGQFTAREMRGRPSYAPSPVAMRVPIAGSLAFLVTAPAASETAQPDKIPLEPALLAVSCERMKELFLLELGMKDEWQGKIELIINSSLPEDRGPLLTGVHRPDGWSYELELPKTIQPRILVRAVIQTLLAELANRRAGSQSAEIPFWLVEGLSGHLQAYNVPTFIIRPNVQSAGYYKLGIEGLNAVRAGLRGHAPLTFQQLSWPEWSNVTGKDQAVYDSCAELFYESLLHLNDGQSCLRRMLEELPRHMNWQTSFLLAFHSHFARLLDVEKWWGLNCVSFTEADLTQPWTEQECWRKLQEALDVPVEVHFAPSRMPAKALVTLQEAILEWDTSDALPALQRAVRELQGLQWFTFRCDLTLDAPAASPAVQRNAHDLQALQWRIGRELSPLVSRYLAVLLNYVNQSQSNGRLASDAKFGASSLRWLKSETVRQLNDLDQKRAAMRAKFSSASRASEVGAAGASGTNSGPAPSPQFHP
jgi:hypothetical protein